LTREQLIQGAALALLCLLAYAPALPLPLIEDDYPSLTQAQVLGGPQHLSDVFHHSVFRVRATSVWCMYWLWKAFHLTPIAYHAFSLLLHILNTWLVWAIAGRWPGLGAGKWPGAGAFWAAAFFAVHEGHQEAVMWFTAINELWMFVFGAAALWFGVMRGRRVLGLVLFFLALISKESAVIFLPLFWLAVPDWRRLMPYAILGIAVTASIFLTRGSANFRFADGSFAPSAAPFWLTWPRGVHRVLWIWGWIAAVWIWLRGDAKRRESALRALVWIAVALLPYIFVTYTTEIPSRQTYLATVGLCFLFGLAMTTITRRSVIAAVAAVVLVHNVGILWVRKRAQFLERAAPTERLIELARSTPGPIWVQCFPRTDWIAKEAVRLGAGRSPETDLVWSEAEARERGASAVFCHR
jgi:hypothetical protein